MNASLRPGTNWSGRIHTESMDGGAMSHEGSQNNGLAFSVASSQ
jgi:hypothetical protein